MKATWYTATGDDGYTSALGRERVPKYADRIEACGTVDEVSAALGLARAQAQDGRVRELLLAIQRDLSRLMGDLATVPPDAPGEAAAEAATRPPWLPAGRLLWLEQTIDELAAQVEMPRSFIVPCDSVGGAALDVARTVVRRAERVVARLWHKGELRGDTPLKYLNRLSSLLFLLARLEDKAEGVGNFTPTVAG